ncbi:hypothetical protein BO86DRAFT_451789 [Aspergillus japonicus CBS 114.51]|uniref:Concanavalin A-like lectin/glucanase n=1 Tax=Aspergillus japonicus CBS 114.51 TaxID=1448312 RepID=A0A8T8WK76_ASPJA|nr:hypothetical protein BO86DRAFT_451789 [Aspergillus japonicus CBS 114.51]RAH76235.1 hypothetical protein BO86DRAFT_451789 [Aspergillus japonicus CBS 114.51]
MQVLSTLAILPTVALAAVLPAALQSGTKVAKRDSWGGSVSLGPTKSDIINAVTTLIPGTAPATQNGELFLWPGMSNGTGDLIQTTMESWPSNAWCGATTGQWCVRASIFGSFGQLDGTGSAVSGDDHVRIEYNLLSDDNTWVQTVTNAVTGAALSNYSYASGPYMTGYGTGTECDSDCTGTVAAQVYLNTTITLREADTTFGDTIATGAGATYTGLSSSEGGKVWTIATINIPAMGSETAVASSTSAATAHSTPVETAVVEVEESSTVATSVATSYVSASAAFGDDADAAPSASPSGQRSGHGFGGAPKPSQSVGAAPSGAFGQGYGSGPRPSVNTLRHKHQIPWN